MSVDDELGEIYDDGAQLDYVDDFHWISSRRRHRAMVDILDHAENVDCWIKATEERLKLLKIAAIALEIKIKCESPIEVEFGAELMAQCPEGYHVYPQFVWQSFRMDFAVLSGGKIIAFIECDGAEFHCTSAQIANDERKNSAAEEAGIRLFRFTGKDIFRNAWGCANYVWGEI